MSQREDPRAVAVIKSMQQEIDKLRTELAELQRDRDDLARQAEAAAEVNRQLDAELAEAKRERDEFGAAFTRVTEEVCGDAGWQCAARTAIELAEANARVAELVKERDARKAWVTTDELLPELNHTVLVWWDERESICEAFLAKEGWSHGIGIREVLPFRPRLWRPMPPTPAAAKAEAAKESR